MRWGRRPLSAFPEALRLPAMAPVFGESYAEFPVSPIVDSAEPSGCTEATEKPPFPRPIGDGEAEQNEGESRPRHERKAEDDTDGEDRPAE